MGKSFLLLVMLAGCGGAAPVGTPDARVDAPPATADIVAMPDVAAPDAQSADVIVLDAEGADVIAEPASPCTDGRAVCDCPDGSRRFTMCVGEVPGPCPCVEMEASVDVVAEATVDAPSDIVAEASCVSMTVGNCCGVACPVASGAASATCTAGRCGFVCSPFRGDCDGDPVNGCEVDLERTTAHCGACRAPCAEGLRCNGSAACTTTCRTGLTACPVGCVDPQGDAMNCGFCGRVCAPPRPSCFNGRCL